MKLELPNIPVLNVDEDTQKLKEEGMPVTLPSNLFLYCVRVQKTCPSLKSGEIDLREDTHVRFEGGEG